GVEPETVTIRLKQGRDTLGQGNMTKFGPGDWRYDGPPLQNPVDVEIWGGDDDQGPFAIDPVDRPRVAELRLVSKHPTQKEPETHTFSGQDADLAFLPETHLQPLIASTVPVSQARLTSNVAK